MAHPSACLLMVADRAVRRGGQSMTETEWLDGADARAMFSHLGARLTHRQQRLFALACGRRHCRCCWELSVFAGTNYNPLDPAASYFRPVRMPNLERLSTRLFDLADEQCDGANHRYEIESPRRR